MEQIFLDYFRRFEDEIFADLEKLVRAEASTSDTEALENVRRVLSDIITDRIGAAACELGGEQGHSVVSFEIGNAGKTVTLVGHYDTVHPVGSVAIRREGNRLYGPGVYDMKGGLISAIWTAKALQDMKLLQQKQLRFLFNGDEETGSEESREIIKDHVLGSKAAIVCEPCLVNGDLKTGRKGGFMAEISIAGKAAHAGNDHQNGRNAIEEMAREIQYIHSLTDYEKGTTLNVGLCSGGSKVNVVPDSAEFKVDCRVKTVDEYDRVKNILASMPVTVAGTGRNVSFWAERPPMMETEENMALFHLAQESGRKLGLSFSNRFVGGGSDGNYISSYGIPTLDSMGPIGDGAHTKDEYIFIDQYITRIALLSSIVWKI